MMMGLEMIEMMMGLDEMMMGLEMMGWDGYCDGIAIAIAMEGKNGEE
jgi:hypothetical protein